MCPSANRRDANAKGNTNIDQAAQAQLHAAVVRTRAVNDAVAIRDNAMLRMMLESEERRDRLRLEAEERRAIQLREAEAGTAERHERLEEERDRHEVEREEQRAAREERMQQMMFDFMAKLIERKLT